MIRILVLLTILSGTIALSIQVFDDQLINCPKDVIPYSPHNLNPQNIRLVATGFWKWPVEGNKGGSRNEVFVLFNLYLLCRNLISENESLFCNELREILSVSTF